MSDTFPSVAGVSRAVSPRSASAFGDVVRRIRDARDLTQTALAAKMKQSVSYVSLIESGRRKPTQRVVANLRSAVELTPEEEIELQIAANLPTSPLDSAVQQCIMALEEVADIDTFDRHVIRQDLSLILGAWKDTLTGKREMGSGRFEAAQTYFQRVSDDAALSAMARAFAASRLADIQEKRGQLEGARQAIQHAQHLTQQTVRPQDPVLGRALRGDISGTLGFMAARAGETLAAKAMTEMGRQDFNALLAADAGPEAEIVARIGIASSDARRALDALFTGEPKRGLSYAQEGLKALPSSSQPDIVRIRLRLLALEAFAESQEGNFLRATQLREEILHGYEGLHDAYGLAKNQMYSADDRRLQLERLLGEHPDPAATPEERRQHVDALRRGTDLITFVRLLDDAITDYRDSLATLEQMGDRILLARGWRNLGDILRYKWLLDRREEDHDECELCLRRAVGIEEETTQDSVNQGRRLPNAYESRALLAWDEGSLAAAADWYIKAQVSLQAQGASTDPAGRKMLRRITAALQRVDAELRGTSTASAGESGASEETRWQYLTGRLEQFIVAALLNAPDIMQHAVLETDERWQRKLYELELQEGPRILAQSHLSSALFAEPPATSSSDEVARYHQARRRKIEEHIRQAQQIKLGGALYQDICAVHEVESAIRACAKQDDRYEGVVHFLREAEGIYSLTPVPYDIPIGFAIKGNLLLVEAPRNLVKTRLGVSLDGPGQFACFSLEGDIRLMRDLMRELSAIFTQMLEIGREISHSRPGSVEWLQRESDASRLSSVSGKVGL